MAAGPRLRHDHHVQCKGELIYVYSFLIFDFEWGGVEGRGVNNECDGEH